MFETGLGRIVHFESENGARAAVIVEVFSDDVVSLRVFGATNEEGVAKLYTSVKRGTDAGEWHPYDGNAIPDDSTMFITETETLIEDEDESVDDESELSSSPKSSKSKK
jgi:hypothetical protein